MPVTLREITGETVRAACALDAGDAGIQVAPNAVALAQAHFWPEAWFRAICADDTPVGFVMLHEPTLAPTPEETEFFLWWLMIDRTHQGRGYGRATIERLVEHVRTRPGATELRVSHVPSADALARLHRSLRFRDSGEQVSTVHS